jgi:hypothetical protein
MIALLWFVLAVVAAPFKSKCRLEAENAALRHQLIVLRRTVHSHVRLTNNDRWFFIQLYRWFPSILQVLTIVRPETLVRWHRAGFRRYWRWKSRPLGGRPQIDADLRALIRRMSVQNRSVSRLVFRKKRPAASTASMANVRASTADDELALVADSSSCCSLAFKGLPFALTMLARQFPGACSNAVI